MFNWLVTSPYARPVYNLSGLNTNGSFTVDNMNPQLSHSKFILVAPVIHIFMMI